MAKGTKKRTPEERQPVLYETARGRRPSWEFLDSEEMPSEVRAELLVTIGAVLQVGPPRFPTSTQRWRLMHKPASKREVDLSGICEARDKHSDTLYRLFCVIDRNAPEHGFAAPSLVLLGGVIKPTRTEAPQSEYRRIDRYRKDYWMNHRVARGQDRVEWWPNFGSWTFVASMLRSHFPTQGVPMHRSKQSAVFAELLAKTFTSDEERISYEREVAKLIAFAELLNIFDEVRAGSQLSKAELARRIGVKPSVVSRLLDGKGRNVQLNTVADVADGLDVYIEMRVRPQPKRKQSRHAPIEVLAA